MPPYQGSHCTIPYIIVVVAMISGVELVSRILQRVKLAIGHGFGVRPAEGAQNRLHYDRALVNTKPIK
jgi:hypothetical protein